MSKLMRKCPFGAVTAVALAFAVTAVWAPNAVVSDAKKDGHVVIYDGVSTEVVAAAEPSKDLWVTTKDLARATRFVIKRQGVCRDELCFPLPKARQAGFIARKGAVTWFNLSEFARLIKQPFAADEKNGVWYFGPRAVEQNSYLS